MSKISEYTNYSENVPSGGTTAKFQETGVIPVSGKYKDDGTMETRNVKMSDLVGGGGGVPTPGADHADVGKVLTVKNVDNTDEIVWDAPQGGFPQPPSDYESKDYFLHINKTSGTIEWALAAS